MLCSRQKLDGHETVLECKALKLDGHETVLECKALKPFHEVSNWGAMTPEAHTLVSNVRQLNVMVQIRCMALHGTFP